MAETIVDKIIVAMGFSLDDASVKRAIKGINAVTDAAAGFATGIGGLLSAAAGFTFVVAEQNAAIQDQAKALNLTTEAYTELAYAAELSGLTTEGLRMGLMTLQRQLGAAAGGSKEAVALFDSLGVAITDADGRLRTSAEVLPEIADGLKALDSDGERAAIQMRLLGEQGTRFNDLFSKGSEGMAALTQEARDFGAVLGDDVAERSAQLDDSLVRLRKVMGGLAKTFADDLIPAVQPLVEQLTEFLGNSNGIVRSGIDTAARSIAFAFRFLATDAGKAAAAIGAIAVGLSTARNADGIAGLAAQIPVVGKALNGMATSLAAVALPAGLIALAIGSVALVLEDLYVTGQGGDSVTRRLADALGIGNETARLAAAGFKILQQSFEITGLVIEGLLLEIGDLISAIAEGIPKAVEVATRSIERMASALGIKLDLAGVRDQVSQAALDYRKFTTGGAAGLAEGFAFRQEATLSQLRGERPVAPMGGINRMAFDYIPALRGAERIANQNYNINVGVNAARSSNIEEIIQATSKEMRKQLQATEELR